MQVHSRVPSSQNFEVLWCIFLYGYMLAGSWSELSPRSCALMVGRCQTLIDDQKDPRPPLQDFLDLLIPEV